jgi:hypothetical protein
MSQILTEVTSKFERLNVEDFLSVFSKYSSATKSKITKVEVLQSFYEPESITHNEFIKGNIDEAIKMIPEERKEEANWHRELCRRGIFWQRLRLVKRPLTKYLQWEFETYKVSARYGQRICMIDITDEETAKRFKEAVDFILFDDSAVLVNWYDKKGAFCGGWEVLDKAIIARCKKLADELMSVCIPMAEFEMLHNL